MIERIYLLLEILAFLLVINDLFDKKFKLDFPAIVMIATDVILFKMARQIELSEIYLMIPYVLLFGYCLIEFRSPIKTIISKVLLSFMSLEVIQLIIGLLSFVIKNAVVCDLVINVIIFITVLILVKKRFLYKLFNYIGKNSRLLFNIIMYCACFFIIIFVCYLIFGRFTILEYLLVIVVYALLMRLIYIWKKEHEKLAYKTQELATFHTYHTKEKLLYREVRSKQHELKNQLNAIYSSHYTCATYEELVNAQKKYADWIKEDNRYTDLLLSCKPSVLAGFIYSQLEYARQKKIDVTYSVSVQDIEDTDREYDYICLFGVLFDNAIEAIENNLVEERQIEVIFYYDEIHTDLRIDNISPYIKNEEIKNWFVETYSEKGENRGYGLSNLMKIKEKYQADVVVENVEKQSKNWISISFKIGQPAE